MTGTLDSATVGIQSTDSSPPALQVAYNSSYVKDGLAVRIALNNEDSWLSYSPLNGIIPPAGATSVLFNCNSQNLNGGVYEAVITVVHNDPTSEPVLITVEFIIPEPVWFIYCLLIVFFCCAGRAKKTGTA